MSSESVRVTGKFIRGVCVLGALVGASFLALGGYDCATDAQSRWDCSYLWVAPVIIVIAGLIYFACRWFERRLIGD